MYKIKQLAALIFLMLLCVTLTFSPLTLGFLISSVVAAPVSKDPVVAPCTHVANADTIKVYYCEDIYLFVNDRGFMAFEP